MKAVRVTIEDDKGAKKGLLVIRTPTKKKKIIDRNEKRQTYFLAG